MRFAILCLFCMFAVSGCALTGRDDVKPPITISPPTPDEIAIDTKDPIALAAAQVARAKAALEAAKAELAAAKAAAAEAERAHLRALLAWVSGIALLGAIACAVAAIFVPVGKRWCAVGSVACGVVLAMAWGIRELLPYLPVIGMALLAGVVLVGILALRRTQLAAMLAADHADRVEKVDPNEALLMLEQKVESMGAQAKANVWGLLESLRVKSESMLKKAGK